MAIVGTGVDLERVSAIERAIARHGERFLKRIFTASEIAYCHGRAPSAPGGAGEDQLVSRGAGEGPRSAQSFTARFCAKEAFRKALGAPPGIRWVDIEVAKAPSGAPLLKLHARAAELLRVAGVTRCHLSLSHSGDYAIAHVVLEREP